MPRLTSGPHVGDDPLERSVDVITLLGYPLDVAELAGVQHLAGANTDDTCPLVVTRTSVGVSLNANRNGEDVSGNFLHFVSPYGNK